MHFWHQNICWDFYIDELLRLTEHGLVLVPLDVIEVVHDDVKYTLALGTSGILRKNRKIWDNSDYISWRWQNWPKSAKNRPNLKIRISTIVDLVGLYLHKKFQPSSLNNGRDLRGGGIHPPPRAWHGKSEPGKFRVKKLTPFIHKLMTALLLKVFNLDKVKGPVPRFFIA